MSSLAVRDLSFTCLPTHKGDFCMPAFESCSMMRAATCAIKHKLGHSPLVTE